MTAKEVNAIVSQNAIPSKQQLGEFLPYAFTEHGNDIRLIFEALKKLLTPPQEPGPG